MAGIQTWWADLPDDTLVETAWERQMNLSGIDAYENTRDHKKASSSASGQKMLRKLVDTTAEAISVMQKEMVGTNRVERNLKATVIVVPADTIALLCLKPMIDRTYGANDPDCGAGYQSLAETISKAVELELNFRNWVESSRQTAADYAAAKGLEKIPRSMAERIIEDQGVTVRGIRNWRKTFSELSEFKWDTLQLHYCGDALLTTVVQALPDQFEIHHVFRGGNNKKHVRMTQRFREQFNNMEYHVASMQMQKKPMLTRPKKWERSE